MEQRVVLFPSNEQAYAYRKQCALSGESAAFGLNAVSFSSWVHDLWGLFGDGRTIASTLDRQFAVRCLLSSAHSVPFALTDGVVSLVADFFRDSIGSNALEQAVSSAPDGLSDAEKFLVASVNPYRKLLAEHSLVEIGDALRALESAPLPKRIFLGEGFQAPEALVDLACGTGIELVSLEKESPCITGLNDGCKPAFLFAAGPTAQDAQIAQYLSSALQDVFHQHKSAQALVVTARPFEVFGSLSAAFGEGCQIRLQTSRPFDETAFGRAYNALGEFLLDRSASAVHLLDFFDSSFSGMDELRAAQCDSAVRGNRLLAFEDLIALARLSAPNFEVFEQLFSEDSEAAFAALEAYIDEELPGDEAFCHEQMAALLCLKNVYGRAKSWKVDSAGRMAAAGGYSIGASRSVGQGAVVVQVMDKAALGTVAIPPYDVVLMCDLDDRFYSASEPHSALVTLKKKLGMRTSEVVLPQMRRSFQRAKASAASHFACQRVVNSIDGEDIYPAVVLDEFCEALCGPDEEMGNYGVPQHLQGEGVLFTRGEELFSANAEPTGIAPERIALNDCPKKELESGALLYRRTEDGTPVLSPSSIEAYVNCPHKWFVSNRLHPEAPDEEFGALEQGSFVHSVWERFYARIEEELGSKRVTSDNAIEAKLLLGKVFDEELLRQQSFNEGATRYVPLTATEKTMAEKLKATLQDNLEVHATMLGGFEPFAHELSIRPEEGIMYAGVCLNGRADRIDVNPQFGQYVVVDYKGSIAGHDAGLDLDQAPEAEDGDDPYASFALPQKIQALIYAQALRGGKVPGHPVGALYASYRAKGADMALAGSYSSLLDDIGKVTRKSAVTMGFESYLDLVEQRVSERLRGLFEGKVEPDPLCADSCRYCPVVVCERRL